MSITFNGTTQFASRATAPSATEFLVAGWFRRNSDSGANESWWSIDDGTFGASSQLYVSSADTLVGSHSFDTSGTVLSTVTSTWYWVMFRISGGTRTIQAVADGGTAWGTPQSNGGMGALTRDTMTLGAAYGQSSASGFAPMSCALLKVWSGTLPTDTEVLAERLSTTATVTTGLWGRYVFGTGALDTDDSGNARTLTLTAAPTFTADAPTDLAAGGATPTVSGIAPTSGPVGTTVTVSGTNLSGVSAVSINGTAGTGIASNTATGFTFVVDTGTTTGALALTATAGSLTGGPTFTVTVPDPPVFTEIVIVTNANVEYTPGVLLSPIVAEKRDQNGTATTLGPSTATITDILNTVDAFGNPVTLVGTPTESFVGAQVTFDDLTPTAALPAVARGTRVLMLHYST